MKILEQRRWNRAFTLIDLFVVAAVFAVVMILIAPAFRRPRVKGGPSCQINLKQIGLAFRTWEGDYNDLYPMSYFTNESGFMKYANAANAFRYFQVMSNELNNPKLLLCPEDRKRNMANNFDASFSGANISYFIGLDGDEKYPTRLLSGDRNLTNGMKLNDGILAVMTNQAVGWTPEQHKGIGNILFSDGSVQQLSAQGLKDVLAQTGLATNRLAMP